MTALRFLALWLAVSLGFGLAWPALVAIRDAARRIELRVRKALNRALYCRRGEHRIGVEAETPGCVLVYCLDCPHARFYWTRPSEWCHHPINPRRRRRAA